MTKEELEKENTETSNKLENIKNYLAYSIPNELIKQNMAHALRRGGVIT